MKCQICSGVSELAFRKNNYNILRCTNCNHFFTQIRVKVDKMQEIYSDRYFFGGEVGYPDYRLEEKILVKHGEYYARKISKIVRTGKVLDVGSAAGFILKGFQNMGWKGTGIEPNEKMVEYGVKNLGMDLRVGSIERVKLEAEYDLIIMIQVIAHLYGLSCSLKNISDSLKPSGYLLIETWDRSSITTKIFGKNWHEYSPPSTLNYFDRKTLDLLMIKSGFKKVKSGWPKKRILSNHAKSLFKTKMSEIRLLKNISGIINIVPDNIFLPYPAEDLFWALYQKVNK